MRKLLLLAVLIPLTGCASGLMKASQSGDLTASESNQITSTLNKKGHGLFTYYLLKGLNGAAKDSSGKVTLKGLYDYLTPKVQDEAGRQNRDQTPTLHTNTDLILRAD